MGTGIEIVSQTYLLTQKFPKGELYGLVSQMRRAAVSIPSNIAEGHIGGHKKEFIQFLYISLGSCAELETQIIITERLKYISSNESVAFIELLKQEIRQIGSLISKLEKQIPNH